MKDIDYAVDEINRRFEERNRSAEKCYVKELEEENAELRERCSILDECLVTSRKNNNKRQEIIDEYTGQLTEAKKIIRTMKHLLFDVCGYIAFPFEKRVNDFLEKEKISE